VEKAFRLTDASAVRNRHVLLVDDVITLSARLVSDEVSIEDAIVQVLQKYPQFGRKEQPEEKKPTFSAGGNPTAGTNQEDAFLKALGLNN